MRRVVLLALCALLLCGCARNNDLADAIASSISVSTLRPTIRPIGKPTAEPKPTTEPEAESEPEPEAYTEEGALYLVSLYGGMPERGGFPHRHGAQGFQRGVRVVRLGKR